MISVSVTIPKLPNGFGGAINKSLWQSALLVRREASLNAPFKTGTLRRSITEKVYGDKATVGTNIVYAKIHEYGGTIYPKKAKRLAFKINGKWIFAKKVRIPKRPYLVPALTDNRNKISEIFARNIRDELAGKR